MTYSKNGTGAETLLQIAHPEGFTARENGSYVYKYLKTDHVGSTRVVLAARGGSMMVEQQTDYYPFGLAHQLSNLHLNKYLYGGKELQDARMGNLALLGLYDFHARYYNPVLGRWFNIDPALQTTNPYLYCGNNPMAYIDPDGQFFFAAAGIGLLLNGMCWGATIAAASYTMNVAMSPGGFDNWDWGRFGKSVAFGALSGAFTVGIGEAFGGVSSFGNEFGRAMAHGIVQGNMAGMQGGDFMSGFASGALGSAAGSGFQKSGKFGNSTAGMLGFSAVAGGVGSAVTGGNFWQGAATGLMVGGLNHLQHQMTDWTNASRAKKIMAVLEAHKEAVARGEAYFDLRKSVKNFPIYGSGETRMAYVMIDGEKMPVYMNIVYNENMKISTGFQVQPDAPTGGMVDGISKAGAWASYGFNQHTDSSVGYGIPRIKFQVPVANRETFYNYISK